LSIRVCLFCVVSGDALSDLGSISHHKFFLTLLLQSCRVPIKMNLKELAISRIQIACLGGGWKREFHVLVMSSYIWNCHSGYILPFTLFFLGFKCSVECTQLDTKNARPNMQPVTWLGLPNGPSLNI